MTVLCGMVLFVSFPSCYLWIEKELYCNCLPVLYVRTLHHCLRAFWLMPWLADSLSSRCGWCCWRWGLLYRLLANYMCSASASSGNHGNWLCCHFANPVYKCPQVWLAALSHKGINYPRVDCLAAEVKRFCNNLFALTEE